MHVFLGIVVTLLAFLASAWAEEVMPYAGLFNPAALVLLALGPIGVSLVSHPFSEWRSNLMVLLHAFGHNKLKNLSFAADEMTQIARAVRETRWNEAEDAIAQAKSEQVKNLAPHLLTRYEQDALDDAVSSSAFRWMAHVKTADDFLQSLARSSPAFGMIGTIMGLVDLFANMRDSASLGPGMAMALLATLYGLILCYCIYMPLSARVRAYLTAGVEEQRAVERAIGLLREGRPIGEIRRAIMEAGRNGDAAHGPVVRAEAESR